MNFLNSHSSKSGLIIFAYALLVATLSGAYAIDNPDAPDYISQFASMEMQYIEKINDPKNTDKAYLIAYDDYLLFLDRELNSAYKLLITKLPEAQREAFKGSQKKWIQFRDAEFGYINGNWTRDNFGSSAGMSRGAYRSEIVKDRVLQMLHYLKNY
jgi:uncharacterized protein YecT (DUF1311 family)